MKPEEEVTGGRSELDCSGSWMLNSGLQIRETLAFGQWGHTEGFKERA